MFWGNDLAKMPRTYPTTETGRHTPGTTQLIQPPEGTLPPSPARVTAKLATPVEVVLLVRAPIVTSLARTMLLSQTLAEASRQLLALRSHLFDNREAVEQARLPLPVITVTTDDMDPFILTKNYNAHDRCNKSFAMTTLVTSAGRFHIEGHMLAIAILDTGAHSFWGERLPTDWPYADLPY